MSKVKFNFSRKIKPKGKEENDVLLIVTYHPSLNCLSKIFRENLYITYLLYMNDHVKRVSSSKLISFRNAKKLSSYLVRAKIYPFERSGGSYKCGKKCWEVWENLNKTESFTSSVTFIAYKINHRLNCNNKCLFYLLMCQKCRNYNWRNYRNISQKMEQLHKEC